jgi:hypothetical protein
MPRIVGPGSSKFRLSIVVIVVLFAFTPISRALLSSVDGSFSPSPFTSLALRTPANPGSEFEVGDVIGLRVTNRTGTTKTYHWNATQHGVVISLGETTVANGHGADVNVPTSFGRPGTVRIALDGTNVFVTLSLQPAA